jgi:tetratricopeptide (TPR) repeat protein
MNYQGSPDQQVSAGRYTRTIFSVLAALLFTASASTTFAQSPEVRSAFRYYDIEQPSKMIPALEKAVQAKPEEIYYLGLGYIMVGNLDKALATFEKGIAAEDKDPLVVAGKGHVKLLQKKTAEGKALLAEAADMNRRKSASQWEAIGRAYLSDTKFLLDAISALQKAKEIDNGDREVHLLLGDAYLLQNQGGESVSSYERAASADQKWAKPLYKIAQVYKRSRNNEVVMDYLTRAVTVDPEYAPAWHDLGEAYYVQKKADKAVEALEKYLSISETPGEAKFQLAFFYIMAKNYEKANAIFKEVLNGQNATPTAWKYYALSLLEQKKYAEARPVFEKYLQTEKPEKISPSDYGSYGKLLLELNLDSLANESFAKGIQLDTGKQEVDMRELNAKTLYQRKKYKEAAAAYKDLASVKKKLEMPESAYDLFYMGHSLYLDDQYQAADSAFTRLSEIQPNSSLGYLYAAKARAQYDSAGAQGLAVPMYEKYIQMAVEDTQKNKKELIDAYDYLGQYALYQKNNVEEATMYFKKILELDPKNQRATDFMDAVQEMKKPQPRGGKG